MRTIPNRAGLAKYNVNRPGWEAIRQSLYDFQTYAAAGQTTLQFFTVPNGQGGKTLSDTNMTLAGQLPAAQEFLVNSIEVYYLPTVGTSAAPAVTDPATHAVTAVASMINDVYRFYQSGNLVFTIGSKPYLQEAPLGRFPGKTKFDLSAAVSQNVAANESHQVFAQSQGRPYLLSPADLRLTSSQNFNVTLNWPEGLRPVSVTARVGVILDGIMYRRSQ